MNGTYTIEVIAKVLGTSIDHLTPNVAAPKDGSKFFSQPYLSVWSVYLVACIEANDGYPYHIALLLYFFSLLVMIAMRPYDCHLSNRCLAGVGINTHCVKFSDWMQGWLNKSQ
jgi:S-adenosylmethionine synthetase